MRDLRQPDGFLIGALSNLATDMARADLFSWAAHRDVPFQILYPASAPGQHALYVPDADPVNSAIANSNG